MKVFQLKKYKSSSIKIYQISSKSIKRAKLSFLKVFTKEFFRNFTNSHFSFFYVTLLFLAYLYNTMSDKSVLSHLCSIFFFTNLSQWNTEHFFKTFPWKGGKFFLDKKRWLKKSIAGMSVWFWLGIV